MSSEACVVQTLFHPFSNFLSVVDQRVAFTVDFSSVRLNVIACNTKTANTSLKVSC